MEIFWVIICASYIAALIPSVLFMVGLRRRDEYQRIPTGILFFSIWLVCPFFMTWQWIKKIGGLL